MDISQISVILSGTVAILALFVTPLINLCIEIGKWNREQKSSAIKEMEIATRDFLACLQYFSDPEWRHRGEEARLKLDELRRNFFTWEIKVGARCDENESISLSMITRKMIGSQYSLSEYLPDLTKSVIDLSRQISKKL